MLIILYYTEINDTIYIFMLDIKKKWKVNILVHIKQNLYVSGTHTVL